MRVCIGFPVCDRIPWTSGSSAIGLVLINVLRKMLSCFQFRLERDQAVTKGGKKKN